MENTFLNCTYEFIPNFTVFLICGIPGVGKTYFSKHFINFTKLFNDKFVGKLELVSIYLNFDELFYQNISSNSTNTKNDTTFNKINLNLFKNSRNEFFNIFKEKFDNLFLRFAIDKNSFSQKKYIFIIDDNFYFKSMRKPFYKLCKKFINLYKELNFSYLELHLKCDLKYALYLNSKRKEIENIPESVINKINDNFQYNSFNNKLKFEVVVENTESLSNLNLEDIFINIIDNIKLLKEITFSELENKISKKENKLLFVDMIESEIRKRIGEIIKQNKNKKDFKIFSESKKEFMNIIKCLIYKENNVKTENKEIDNYKDLLFIIKQIKENNYILSKRDELENIIIVFNNFIIEKLNKK